MTPRPPLLESAIAAAQSGRIGEGIDLFRQMVESHPECLEAWGHLGYLLFLCGRTQEALSCFEELAGRNPEDRGARRFIADCLFSLGRKPEARQAYLSLEPGSPVTDPEVQSRIQALRPTGQVVFRKLPRFLKSLAFHVFNPTYLSRFLGELFGLQNSLPGIRASGWNSFLEYLDRHYCRSGGWRFPRPPCDYCGASDWEAVFFLEGQKNVRCRGCGLQFVEGRPEESLDVFEDWYNQDSSIEFMEKFWGNENFFHHRLDLMKGAFDRAGYPLPREGESAFEVGVAEGHLLAHLRDRGLRVSGIETGGKLVERCRNQLGLNVEKATIREASPSGGPYDYFFAYHVLEHLEKPSELFLKAREFLREGGLLLIEVPVPDLPPLSLNQQLDPLHGFGNLGHLHYFTMDTLSAYFRKFGFEILSTYTYNEETLPSGGILGRKKAPG